MLITADKFLSSSKYMPTRTSSKSAASPSDVISTQMKKLVEQMEAAEALALRVTSMVKDSAWARPDLELNLAGVTAAAIHPPEGGERTGRRALPARNA